MSLRSEPKALLRSDVKLSSHVTMQVGGPARYFAEPASEQELLLLLEWARSEKVPFVILGKGSNTVFPDEGYPGLVITLIHYELERVIFDHDRMSVTASAGIHLYKLVQSCAKEGMGGIEFLANIPGTLGGALLMNAGFSRIKGVVNQIGDFVQSVTVLTETFEKRVLERQNLKFSYRHSNLDDKIILSGTLALLQKSPEAIREEVQANFAYRNEKQDLRYPSSGSLFKNPPAPHPPAAKLVQDLGLKGFRVGGAMISEKHSNYLVNVGKATYADIRTLVQEVQEKVYHATGVRLEPEVRFIEKA